MLHIFAITYLLNSFCASWSMPTSIHAYSGDRIGTWSLITNINLTMHYAEINDAQRIISYISSICLTLKDVTRVMNTLSERRMISVTNCSSNWNLTCKKSKKQRIFTQLAGYQKLRQHRRRRPWNSAWSNKHHTSRTNRIKHQRLPQKSIRSGKQNEKPFDHYEV